MKPSTRKGEVGSKLTLLDVPLIQLEGELLLELLNVVLGFRRRADLGIVDEFDESSEVVMVLGELVGLS